MREQLHDLVPSPRVDVPVPDYETQDNVPDEESDSSSEDHNRILVDIKSLDKMSVFWYKEENQHFDDFFMMMSPTPPKSIFPKVLNT